MLNSNGEDPDWVAAKRGLAYGGFMPTFQMRPVEPHNTVKNYFLKLKVCPTANGACFK